MAGSTLDASARLYRHPPASSGHLPDGAPLDAGTAHLLHNNCSVHCVQATRLLGHVLGCGRRQAATTQWDGITDAAPAGTGTDWDQVSWRQTDVAVVFGPWAAAFTRLQTDPPGYMPRRVRVLIDVEKGQFLTTDLTLFAALVTGAGTPLQATVLAEARVQLQSPSPTLPVAPIARTVELMLEPTAPVAPTDSWRSRDDDSTTLLPLWVWVGYLSTDLGRTADSIVSISAWEVAE